MSWDIFICKFSRTYAALADIGEDERCHVMGTRPEMHAAVSAVFVGTNWADPAWGVYDAPFGSVEFSISDADLVEGMTLHVRADETIVAPIVELCLRHGWQGLDHNAGSFLEQAPVPAAGLRSWMAFREQALQK
jgi:hypothetical protein